MDHFAGLDVSVMKEVKVASEPQALPKVLGNPAYRFKRIGLEAAVKIVLPYPRIPDMRFRFIEDRRADYPVTLLCDLLGVSPAGYYAWRSRPESRRSAANRDLVDDIRRVHRDPRGRYGSPRIHVELKAQGRGASRGRIERLMRRHGIRAIMPRPRRHLRIGDALGVWSSWTQIDPEPTQTSSTRKRTSAQHHHDALTSQTVCSDAMN